MNECQTFIHLIGHLIPIKSIGVKISANADDSNTNANASTTL